MSNVDNEETIEVSQEEELKVNENGNEPDGAEGEDAPEGEGSDAPSSEEGSNGGDEPDQSRERRRENQIERLKREKRELQGKVADTEKGKSSSLSSDLMVRTFLNVNGFKDKETQNEIMKMADKAGLSLEDAMGDEFIVGRAKALEQKRAAEQAQGRPTGSAKVSNKGVDWYIARGEMPDVTKDPDMFYKVQDALIKRAKGSTL